VEARCRSELHENSLQPVFAILLKPLSKLSKPFKISIVDDDEMIREGLQSLLRSLEFDIDAFASAEDFLRSDRVCETSCLITDVHMPGMTGMDLQRQLIADGYRIPIIFMSGYDSEQLGAGAMMTGVIGFLKKPIDTKYLVECLNKARKG